MCFKGEFSTIGPWPAATQRPVGHVQNHVGEWMIHNQFLRVDLPARAKADLKGNASHDPGNLEDKGHSPLTPGIGICHSRRDEHWGQAHWLKCR